MKKVQAIEGFKVMDWIRDMRERRYELYKKDLEAYDRQLIGAGKRLRARINRAAKKLK
jgi:hypothetical protein